MRWVRFGRDDAPRFAAFGVLTPAGVGAGPLRDLGAGPAGDAGAPGGASAPATEVGLDLPALLGEPPLAFRRFDRYGELAYASGRLASRPGRRDAAPAPAAAAAVDPSRGVMLGSSLACWASNVRHHRERRATSPSDPGPATFVRTVANAAIGDLSIALRLGGPGLLFAGGWTAGAEAIVFAASALAERRARTMLAGGVEAPGPDLRALLERGGASPGAWRFAGRLAEGAAIALLEAAGPGAPSEPSHEGLRLHAYARAHDPEGRRSVAALLDIPSPTPLGTVVIANTMPPPLLERARAEAAPLAFVYLPDRTGELGAAGAPAAVALADMLATREGALVMARDPAGSVAALVLGR